MSNVIVDWDQESDVLYVLKSGYETARLQNVDSDRVHGVVKRIVPETGECVGFIIDSFSYVLPAHSKQSIESLQQIFEESIELTNRVARSSSDSERFLLAI